METIQNYDQIDWKKVKAEWDERPLLFDLKFRHGANEIAFDAGIGKNKRIKIMCYINGVCRGEYTDDGHEFQKYMNSKKIPVSAKVKKLDKALKKLTRGMKSKFEEAKPFPYKTPIFDNVTQIKKMVDNLYKQKKPAE